MTEIFSRLSGDELVMLFVFAGMFIFGLSVVFATAWYKHRERELAVAIIQDMLEQGISVDQIERVLKAAGFNPEHPLAQRWKRDAPPEKASQTAS